MLCLVSVPFLSSNVVVQFSYASQLKGKSKSVSWQSYSLTQPSSLCHSNIKIVSMVGHFHLQHGHFCFVLFCFLSDRMVRLEVGDIDS